MWWPNCSLSGQTFSFNFRRPRNQSMTQEGSPQVFALHPALQLDIALHFFATLHCNILCVCSEAFFPRRTMTPTLAIQQQLVKICISVWQFCKEIGQKMNYAASEIVKNWKTLKPGEFNGDGDRLDVAVGMPRGANLTGKVGLQPWLLLVLRLIMRCWLMGAFMMTVVRVLFQVVLYNANLTNLNNVTGDQVTVKYNIAINKAWKQKMWCASFFLPK